jgi:hypothetical protein
MNTSHNANLALLAAISNKEKQRAIKRQEKELRKIANLRSLEEHNMKLAIKKSKSNAKKAKKAKKAEEREAINLQAAIEASLNPATGGRRKTHRRRASHKRRKTHRRS